MVYWARKVVYSPGGWYIGPGRWYIGQGDGILGQESGIEQGGGIFILGQEVDI